jgi:phenylacetate-CoA ligase
MAGSSASHLFKTSLGWSETACAIANRARQSVPAYRELLRSTGVGDEASFTDLPITDKAGYLLGARQESLGSGDHSADIFTVFRSSGSSGHPFYWPQLKEDYRWASRQLRSFLERSFLIHECSTCAVVAMGLGAWVGGDYYSWALKNVALEVGYPFTTMAPGDCHEEVIACLLDQADRYEQLLIVICPSMIGYLMLLAQSLDRPLPMHKLRFLAMGEGFPESLRMQLGEQSGRQPVEPFMFSIYGSADTGALGAESTASVAVRQLLVANPELALSLELGPCLPQFFHFASTDIYLEIVDDELCVTRWQGIPLIRYNLHDQARLIAWEPLRQTLLGSCQADACHPALRRTLEEAEILPDLIAIWGRADSTLILGGTNITESMLSTALASGHLADQLTGVFTAAVAVEEGRATLVLDIEFQPGRAHGVAMLDALYPDLIEAIGKVQPEFAADWQDIYGRWDHDPSCRVLQLRGHPWPTLSSAAANLTKARRLTINASSNTA